MRAGIPVVATFHTWFPRSVGSASCAGRSAIWTATRDNRGESRGACRDVALLHGALEIIPNGVDTPFSGRLGPRRQRSERKPPRCLARRIEPRNDLATVPPNAGNLELIPAHRSDGGWRGRGRSRMEAPPAIGRACNLRLRDGGRPAFTARPTLLVPTTRRSFGVTLLERCLRTPRVV